MNKRIVFSLDEEEFRFDDVEDAYDQAVGDMLIEEGDELVLWQGEAVAWQHKSFVPSAYWIIDQMQSSAYNEALDYSGGYLYDLFNDPEKQAALEQVIADWFDANVEKPWFYTVVNVKKITWKPGQETGDE